jgi:perosamine synthetase
MSLRKRFIPAAVTPLSYTDLIEAYRATKNNEGIKAFEQEIADYIHVESAFSFSSFMRANYACLMALKSIDERKTVLIPRYSCPSFAHAILAAGLSIRYCDSMPDTLSIDIEKLKEIDPDDILALLCVNFFGLSNPMNEITSYCRKNNIYLIEDLGYSLGSDYNNKKLGTFGDYCVLNFQEGKAIPIGGGMVTAKKAEFSEYFLSRKRKPGKSNLLFMGGYSFFSKPENYNFLMKYSAFTKRNIRKQYSMEDTIRKTHSEFDYEFDPSEAFNSISGFQGNLGRILLKRMDQSLSIRNANAGKIESGLGKNANLTIVRQDELLTRCHYIRYPVLIKSGLRDEVIRSLMEKRIETSSMYAEHGLDIPRTDYPGAHTLLNELITLPCHPHINAGEIATMTETIRDITGR